MSRDDIISMYQKANGWSPKGFENTVDELERFAALVAAAEREACAKLVEPSADHRENFNDYLGGEQGIPLLDHLANAIRARGQA